jgi:HPr kinase/phosphorylase
MKPMRIPGVLVAVDGVGILVRGPSGSGKSLTALNLLRRGHHLVADDLVEVARGPDGMLVGRPMEEDVRIEVRGLGIFRVRSLFHDGTLPSCRIDFVVELDKYDPARDAGRTAPEEYSMQILEHDVSVVRVPVPIGVDPGLLVELLAKLFRDSGTVAP